MYLSDWCRQTHSRSKYKSFNGEHFWLNSFLIYPILLNENFSVYNNKCSRLKIQECVSIYGFADVYVFKGPIFRSLYKIIYQGRKANYNENIILNITFVRLELELE